MFLLRANKLFMLKRVLRMNHRDVLIAEEQESKQETIATVIVGKLKREHMLSFFYGAPRMARNLTVKVRYGGWQLPTISQAQGCPS